MDEKLQQLIAQGEGISLEFKRCGNQPGNDVFETICSFANRQGGSILLGVLDDGEVTGVPDSAVAAIERNVVNVTCNPSLFNVAPVIEFERVPVGEGRTVIRAWIPMGPSLYSYKGCVYDRRADVDVCVTGEADWAALIMRKSAFYSEGNVYTWVKSEHLELELLDEVRARIQSNNANHPWLTLSNEEFLYAARLITNNPLTGEQDLIWRLSCCSVERTRFSISFLHIAPRRWFAGTIPTVTMTDLRVRQTLSVHTT